MLEFRGELVELLVHDVGDVGMRSPDVEDLTLPLVLTKDVLGGLDDSIELLAEEEAGVFLDELTAVLHGTGDGDSNRATSEVDAVVGLLGALGPVLDLHLGLGELGTKAAVEDLEGHDFAFDTGSSGVGEVHHLDRVGAQVKVGEGARGRELVVEEEGLLGGLRGRDGPGELEGLRDGHSQGPVLVGDEERCGSLELPAETVFVQLDVVIRHDVWRIVGLSQGDDVGALYVVVVVGRLSRSGR